ncbi:MAG: TorF family putative porin, partial [Tepidimonas ignava]
MQSGVDYDFGNGFYVGNWNSTGKFGSNVGANLEVDLYAGYRGELSKGVGYDLTLTRYIYPSDGGDGWNGNEVAGALSFGPLTVKLTNQFVKNDTDLRRLSLTWTQPINDKMALKAVLRIGVHGMI